VAIVPYAVWIRNALKRIHVSSLSHVAGMQFGSLTPYLEFTKTDVLVAKSHDTESTTNQMGR